MEIPGAVGFSSHGWIRICQTVGSHKSTGGGDAMLKHPTEPPGHNGSIGKPGANSW